MNILRRRRGPTNYAIEYVADQAKAIRDVFHYMEVDCRQRPYLDQDEIDKLAEEVTQARKRLDVIEGHILPSNSPVRVVSPQRSS